MTLRILHFVECQLDDNWYFDNGESEKGGIVALSSWIKTKNKIIKAGAEGAKIGVSVNENHGMTLKFKKGSIVELDRDILVYDMADAL